jgi:hypothetical protein
MAPPFVEIESVPREVNASNHQQVGPPWNLIRLDSARRPMPQTFIPVPFGSQWQLNARSDTALLVFTNGFSGTTFFFALRGAHPRTLRGVARGFSDAGPVHTGPFTVTATRVECLRESPRQETFEWKGPDVDHVIIAIDSLERGMEIFRQITGVRPVYGGVHPGRGTRNALVSLGGGRYLEIIAPNPADASPAGAQAKKNFEIFRRLTAYGWAMHTTNMDSTVAKLERSGFKELKVVPGSRARPDGKLLKWRTMDPWRVDSSLLPFFHRMEQGQPASLLGRARRVRIAGAQYQCCECRFVGPVLDSSGNRCVGTAGVASKTEYHHPMPRPGFAAVLDITSSEFRKP